MFHTGESRFIDVTIRHGPTPNRLTQHMDEQKLLASACQAKLKRLFFPQHPRLRAVSDFGGDSIQSLSSGDVLRRFNSLQHRHFSIVDNKLVGDFPEVRRGSCVVPFDDPLPVCGKLLWLCARGCALPAQ